MEFTNKAPEWNAVGAKPTEDLINQGFAAGYKPPADYFNYMFNQYKKSIDETQEAVNTLDTNLAATDSVVKANYIETEQKLEELDTSKADVSDLTDLTNDYISHYHASIKNKNAINLKEYEIALDATTGKLTPSVSEIINLGDSSKKFQNGYFSGTVTAEKFDGTATAATNDADGNEITTEYAKKYNTRLTGTTYIDDGIVAAEEETDMEGESVYTQKDLWLNGGVLVSADGQELDAEVLKEAGTKLVDKYATKTELETAVDDIKVVGRNLLAGSATHNFAQGMLSSSGFSYNISDNGDFLSGKQIEITCTTTGPGFYSSARGDITGKTYTYSFWAKASDEMSLFVGYERGGTRTIHVTTEWQFYEHYCE